MQAAIRGAVVMWGDLYDLRASGLESRYLVVLHWNFQKLVKVLILARSYFPLHPWPTAYQIESRSKASFSDYLSVLPMSLYTAVLATPIQLSGRDNYTDPDTA